jgi:hypothetical protein
VAGSPAAGCPRTRGVQTKPARPSAARTERDITRFLAELPVPTPLSEEKDATLTTLTIDAREQSRSFEHFELGVDGAGTGWISELLREILDADDPVAVGDRCAHLEPVLRTAKEHSRSLTKALPSGVLLPHYDLNTLDQCPLSELLGMMIAGGGVAWLPARTPWPMHTALRELDEELGRRGLRQSARVSLSFEPSPETGLAARGADVAFQSLIRDGLLRRTSSMLDAGLVIDEQQVVGYRRRLMTLDAPAAAVIQRAGSRWAALASAVAMKPAAAGASRVQQ